MPFTWITGPQLPPENVPSPIPSSSISYKVNLVANTVNEGGTLLYNTAAGLYDVVYPILTTNTEITDLDVLNATWANIKTANVSTLNVSTGYFTTGNIISLNATSANINIFYNTTIVTGTVSAYPTSPLGIASKEYVDSLVSSFTPKPVGFTGQIGLFAGPLANGWISPSPKNVSRTVYANLFSYFGTTYGEGNGTTTFGLPTLQPPIGYYKGNTFGTLPVLNYNNQIGRLSDGRIIMAGGSNFDGSSTDATRLGFRLSSDNVIWMTANVMPANLTQSHFDMLPDGRFLVVGGGFAAQPRTTLVYFANVSGNSVVWSAGTAFPIQIAQGWGCTLSDGRFISVAGVSSGSTIVSTVYYGNVSGTTITWTLSTPFPRPIFSHHAIPLSGSRILVSGGAIGGGAPGIPLTTNVYIGTVGTPNTTWSLVGELPKNLTSHRVVQINDGRLVLIAGTTGPNVSVPISTSNVYFGNLTPSLTWTETDELPGTWGNFGVVYESSDNTIWVYGGALDLGGLILKGIINGNRIHWTPQIRMDPTATGLPDGRILTIGGWWGSPKAQTFFGRAHDGDLSPLCTNSRHWIAGTDAPNTIFAHTTTLLPDGRAILIGGYRGGTPSNTTWFANISGNTISWANGTTHAHNTGLIYHETLLLDDGRILTIGGSNGAVSSSNTTANTYFGSISGNTISWTQGTPLPAVRWAGMGAQLRDGRVIYVGGRDNVNQVKSQTFIGVINANTITWTQSIDLPRSIWLAKSVRLPDGRVFIAGGHTGGTTITATIPNTYIIEESSLDSNNIVITEGPQLPRRSWRYGTCYVPNTGIVAVGGQFGFGQSSLDHLPSGDAFIISIPNVGIKT